MKDITHDKNTQEVGKLSNDLNVLTAEIKGYQNMAGQAVFEIGRRLKWVKDYDLSHGEWLTWLESMNIGSRFAQKSMQIVNELDISNTPTLTHLSMNVLYEIATLPPEERNKSHVTISGEIKETEDMSAREIRELKKQLKEAREEQRQTEISLKETREQASDRQYELSMQLNAANNKLQSANEKLIKEKEDYEEQLKKVEAATNTKIVELIKEPDDYQDLKRKISANEIQIKGNQREKDELYKSIDVLKARADKYAKTETEFEHKKENVERLKQTIDNLREEKEVRQKAARITKELIEMVGKGHKLIDLLELVTFDQYDENLSSIAKLADKLSIFNDELKDELDRKYGITD